MKLEKENWDEKWQKEQEKYRKIWDRSYSWKRIREEIFKRIEKKPGLKVFEFGCGGGKWLEWFKKVYSANVYGIDSSRIGIKIAKSIVKGDLILGDVRKKTKFKDNTFDVTFAIGLLEHFNNTDIKKITDEMYRISKDWIIITTPNRSRYSFLTLYEKIFGKSKSERAIELQQFVSFFRNKKIKQMEIIPCGLFVPYFRNNKFFRKLNLKFIELFKTSDNLLLFVRK
ncbi:MAG: class I SAM-dependent methyltransferase [Candidatus Omnitrophica bacterium]|nr:class I SAM-dependent methyltransferase [Candidatus Omnitrophota bacterium]